MQVSFIDSICLPIYEGFSKMFPDKLRPLYDGVLTNRANWLKLAKEQDKLKDWAENETKKLFCDSEIKRKKEAFKTRRDTTT